MPSELSYSRHQQMHASLVPVAAQHAFVHDVCVCSLPWTLQWSVHCVEEVSGQR